MGRLDRKTAVITGGASGVGAATVRRFVAEGAEVIIADILDDRGKALAEELGDAAVYVHTDVAREEEVAAAIGLAATRWGRLDCLFNNAGAGGVDEDSRGPPDGRLSADHGCPPEGCDRGDEACRADHEAAARRGASSTRAALLGLRSGYGPLVYSIAKAAVIHLSRCTAMELGEWGVRVNCICPGGIVTPIFGRSVGLPVEKADETLGIVSELLRHAQAIRAPRTSKRHRRRRAVVGERRLDVRQRARARRRRRPRRRAALQSGAGDLQCHAKSHGCSAQGHPEARVIFGHGRKSFPEAHLIAHYLVDLLSAGDADREGTASAGRRAVVRTRDARGSERSSAPRAQSRWARPGPTSGRRPAIRLRSVE